MTTESADINLGNITEALNNKADRDLGNLTTQNTPISKQDMVTMLTTPPFNFSLS